MRHLFAVGLFLGLVSQLALAEPGTLTVDLTHPGPKSSPMLYGLMTEEINHCYDGGLYAELIQNRVFLDNAKEPSHWSIVQVNGAVATMELDRGNPLNAQLTTSLRLEVSSASVDSPAGV